MPDADGATAELEEVQAWAAGLESDAVEHQLRPEAYGRRRGGYLDRRRTPAADA